MILTTTPSVEGRTITEYKGVVFGEVVAGVNFIRDFKASIRNIIGGRSGSYEDELIKARTQAMNEMSERAARMGADAVVCCGQPSGKKAHHRFRLEIQMYNPLEAHPETPLGKNNFH